MTAQRMEDVQTSLFGWPYPNRYIAIPTPVVEKIKRNRKSFDHDFIVDSNRAMLSNCQPLFSAFDAHRCSCAFSPTSNIFDRIWLSGTQYFPVSIHLMQCKHLCHYKADNVHSDTLLFTTHFEYGHNTIWPQHILNMATTHFLFTTHFEYGSLHTFSKGPAGPHLLHCS